MVDGSQKSIEEIKVGDKVLATDPKTGKTQPKTVLATITGEGQKTLVEVTVDTDGKRGNKTGIVIATDHHPFWAAGSLKKWIKAANLKPGMWLRTSAGTHVQITAINTWTQHQQVHNLTVDDIPTYYVLAGATPVLVHNSSCDHIALGLQQVDGNSMALDEFGMETGGTIYSEWPGNGAWHKKLNTFLSSGSKTRISFNLDGIDDPVASAAAGKSVDPSGFEGLTNWELHRVSQSPDAWSRITWYRGGSVVDNPFK